MSKEIKEKKSKKKDSKIVKKIKQHMYKWHRTIGLITIIPVIFWTLSGLMHPFMAHFFKPEIAHEKLDFQPIDKNKLQFSIQEVLQKNNIAEFKNFRIVAFGDATFYQVKNITGDLLYFDTSSAKKLENGDQKYAEWLSRYFLDDQKSAIKKSEIVTEFTTQYKYVNRYLPVYKVTLDRPDAMQVYVETSSSKLATYNPTSRQWFIWFFDTFHNWSFIDAITNNSIRIITMIFLLTIIGFSALSGILIYGLLWKQFKKTDNLAPKKGLRKYHRQIGIWVSLFTLTFAFSGAYHATTKWEPYTLSQMVYEPTFTAKEIPLANTNLNVDWSRFQNSSITTLNDTVYYRCQLIQKEKYKASKSDSNSKWNKKEGPKSEVLYINAITNKTAPNIDLEYAQFLAYYFTDGAPKAACCEMVETTNESSASLENAKLVESKVLTDFESREYGFVNKRLPVVKLAYETPEKTTYFIETSTSRLAAVIKNSDKVEGYSFAILHKFLFMDWAGKNIRDLTMVLAALTILIVSILGFILFLKK
ncbi:PepSY-associated TM helix domain-containing protein [Flavobacterium sp. Fl-77]|uniref:PepSY-associated TM helix domain-containing protein n=1 Tax=Flavobacterium flavipigmentatum TaxID=2893884 RepID=A0AAJ2SG74_9FLAO|nr:MULTISPECIES: PepSY-associated TM helix domain-containing protein [unclassified Flavobacterium]MDX6183306.1 PepSY-associated TM helix domain-containing protein [Flavobacterium sp. Fl-33]MDX6186590.1 PepSY-associated TM helix domain-containing protein [Flavobacterium sp. Fl-77]UFH38640.1 PepSY domain-containing protein [Flavobacterium sp. F-70]